MWVNESIGHCVAARYIVVVTAVHHAPPAAIHTHASEHLPFVEVHALAIVGEWVVFLSGSIAQEHTVAGDFHS